jgi:hypothetical protein
MIPAGGNLFDIGQTISSADVAVTVVAPSGKGPVVQKGKGKMGALDYLFNSTRKGRRALAEGVIAPGLNRPVVQQRDCVLEAGINRNNSREPRRHARLAHRVVSPTHDSAVVE